MRKTILTLVLGFILFTTFSCGKDKDDNPSSVVGKWTFIDEDVKIYQGSALQSTTTYTFMGSPYVEFKSDGSYTSKDEDGEVTEGSYSYNSSTKTLSDDDGDYTVTQLTSSKMTLHIEDSEDDGSGTVYKYVVDVHLQK